MEGQANERGDAGCPGASCGWSRSVRAHLGPVDPVEAAGSGGCGGDHELAEDAGSPVRAQVFCCPTPAPPREGDSTCPRNARSWPFRVTHHPESTTWRTVSGMSGTWLQHLQGPAERSKGQGWVRTEPGVGGNSTGQASAPHLLKPLNVGAAELQVTVSWDHHSA